MSRWIGTALSLALCSATLGACNFKNQDANNGASQAGASQAGTSANPSTSDMDGVWSGKTEGQLREAIAGAPANGLKPELFLKGGEKGQALTQAALRYASALANGYSDPSKLHEVYTIPHPTVDVGAGLRAALQKGDVKDWLASLAPQTAEYRALSQAHLHFLQLAAKGNFQAIPDGKPIKPGGRDTRMAQVRAALQAVGYMAAAPAAATAGQPPRSAPSGDLARYSPDLVQLVKRVQAEWGFKPDGIIGGDTLDALNAGPRYRARQLAIAMERLRWLPRTPPATRIDVNTAATFLDYWRDGQHIDHRNVVDGQPDKPTPQLQAPIVRLVAKPTWTVPKGIGETELAKKSQAWLQDNQFTLKNGQYVQQSGPKNSLGLVKFDMQDNEAIYLHDTPAKALFSVPDRHRSHGCVRVDNAVQFAMMIAQQEGVGDQFQQAMQQNDESFIKLPQPIPVRLLYETVFFDGSNVQFRPDAYGWDDNVAKALGLEPGPPQRLAQPESGNDVGP